MAITQELAGYRNRTAALSTDSFLGSVLWYETSACSVRLSGVIDKLVEAGLGHMAPRPPADVDKFRRVWTNGQHKQFSPNAHGVAERLLVRHVADVPSTKDNPGKIVRKVVSEFVSAEKLTLAYPNQGGGEVTFFYSDSHLEIKAYDQATPNAIQLLNELEAQYLQVRGCLDGNALRHIVINTLAACSAINLRDGVFFVPTAYEGVIASLEQWANIMKRDLGVPVSVHSLPLLNDQKQADMVLESAKADIAQDVDTLAVKVMDALTATEGISLRKASTLSGELQVLAGKAKEYEALLNHENLSTVTRLDILSLQVQQIWGKVAK